MAPCFGELSRSSPGTCRTEGCIHVGIRGSLYGATDLTDDRAVGFQGVPAREMETLGTRGMIDQVMARVANRPVDVSVDIDVLGPGLVPGTGTPEAGGVLSRELLGIIRGLSTTNLVGADVVEVAPTYDHAWVNGTAASHVLCELLFAMAAPKR